MENSRVQLLLILFIFFLCSCRKNSNEEVQFTIFKSNGSITTTIDQFRNQLGTLNMSPGALNGRREINWDGVPDSLLDKSLPNNFFNQVGDDIPVSFQRGLIYDEGEFQVSASKFSHINNEASSQFSAFSGDKVFANVSDDLWPIGFQVVGQTTPASIRAFGMVFSDVDLDHSTSLQFFDGEKSLGKFFVPAHDAGSKFSFLGVYFHNRTVSKIKVHHQGILTDGGKDISQGGVKDLIVLDDLIYSEPLRRQD